MKPMAYILPALLIMFPPAKAVAAEDARELVELPQMMRQHMLANMRDHLLALAEIQQHLAQGAFDTAAQTAEARLGLSSLGTHGASHMAPMMPAAMRDIGTRMHRSASRFALIAQESGVDDDTRRALAALAEVTRQCVACHAAYRVR